MRLTAPFFILSLLIAAPCLADAPKKSSAANRLMQSARESKPLDFVRIPLRKLGWGMNGKGANGEGEDEDGYNTAIDGQNGQNGQSGAGVSSALSNILSGVKKAVQDYNDKETKRTAAETPKTTELEGRKESPPPGGGDGGGNKTQYKELNYYWPVCVLVDPTWGEAKAQTMIKDMIKMSADCDVHLDVTALPLDAPAPRDHATVNQLQMQSCNIAQSGKGVDEASTTAFIPDDWIADEMCGDQKDPKKQPNVAGCAQVRSGGGGSEDLLSKKGGGHKMQMAAGGPGAIPSIVDNQGPSGSVASHEAIGHSQMGKPNGGRFGNGIGEWDEKAEEDDGKDHEHGGSNDPYKPAGCAVMRQRAYSLYCVLLPPPSPPPGGGDSFLPIAVPIAFLFAVLMGISRANSEGEILALQVNGFSLFQIFFPLGAFSFLVSFFCLYTSLYTVPQGNRSFEVLITRLGHERVIAQLKPGVFVEGFFGLVLLAEQIIPIKKEMKRVFIYDERDEDFPLAITAEAGILRNLPEKGLMTLRLTNGAIHVDKKTYEGLQQKITFDVYDINLEVAPKGDVWRAYSPPSFTFEQLKERIRETVHDVPQNRQLLVELHRRFSLSFSCVVFAALGFFIGVFSQRGVRSTAIMLCLSVALVYWISYIGANAVAASGSMPAWLAMWIPNVFFLGVSGLSYWRYGRT